MYRDEKVIADKMKFVHELGTLICKYDLEIENLTYDEISEEVKITYINGYVAGVNVAADSLVAIMYDVGKYLCAH